VTGILGDAPPDDAVDQILHRSEGNPFVVEEMVVSVRAGAAPQEIPESVRDVLLARFDSLSRPAQQLLRSVSAAGQFVPDRLIAYVADLDDPTLLSALREAVERHLLVVDPTGTGYAYRHALARRAVYDDMLPGERVRLHAAYGKALSADPSLIGVNAGLSAALALHWYAALDLPRALGASADAGRQAVAAYAPAEALQHFERTLELWTRVHDAEHVAGFDRIDGFRLAADAAFRAGSVARSLALLDEALKDLGFAADPTRQAVLLELRARALRGLGRDAESIATLREALALVEGDPATRERAVVLTALASSLMHVGDIEAARTTAEVAVRAAAAVEAGDEEADALITLGTARAYAEDIPGGLDALRAGLTRALQLQIAETALRGHVNLSDVLEMSGLHEEAATAAQAGVELATRTGFVRTFGAYLTGNLVESLIRLGRWTQADRLARAALEGGPEGVFGTTLLQMRAEMAVGAGRYDDASAYLRKALRLVLGTTDDQFLQPLAYIEADIARATGDFPGGRAIVTAALTGQSTPSGRYVWPLVWLGLRIEADLATWTHDRRQPTPAETLAQATELVGLSTGLPAATPPAQAYSAAVVAEHARLHGYPTSALWWAAVVAWRRAAEPYPLAYVLLRFAAAAFSENKREDATLAIREAAAIAVSVGAVPLVEEAEALARRARVTLLTVVLEEPREQAKSLALTPVDELARFGLTRRERQILALVAAGRSNAQIGTKLFISPKTASVHVSRILAKLGVTGRVEAAAVAHRLGLLPSAL
jgi:ATP/maltotriose-dependent transcriptional regulator MalT